jgi:hypothetical protein
MGGKSIKAGDGPAVRSENKDGGKVAFQILERLALNIGIQLNNPGEEGSPIMIRPKRLDPIID